MKSSQDKFANKFYATVTESAADTLTFKEIQTNVDVFSKSAWVLHRLEYYVAAATMDLIQENLDSLQLALTSSDKMAAIDLSNSGVIDYCEFESILQTAVGFSYVQMPLTRDFSILPGGGLIIAPRPLYLAVDSTALGAAATVAVRGYFTQLSLSADEYLELVDFYRIVQ